MAETTAFMRAVGSSPLARGTQDGVRLHIGQGRFIPAGAGNTGLQAAMKAAVAVHPRWRGEHTISLVNGQWKDGSSPLARGTPPDCWQVVAQRRFIPAGAGNTLADLGRGLAGLVHPRWRGEHGGDQHFASLGIGSSPLARGTRELAHGASHEGRFIPAGAGNTAGRPRRRRSAPVHPRWRGEHQPGGADPSGAGGSSPLARGTHPARRSAVLRLRFIPAGAGNTTSACSAARCRTVHPRRRGEHKDRQQRADGDDGSSPPARGTL